MAHDLTTIAASVPPQQALTSVCMSLGIFAATIFVLELVYRRHVLRWFRTRRRMIELSLRLPGGAVGSSHKHPWMNDLGSVLSLDPVPGMPGYQMAVPWFVGAITRHAKEGEGLYRIAAFNPYRVPFARTMVVVFDPDLIEEILIGKVDKFPKSRHYKLAEALVGDSFLAEPYGRAWKKQRRLCQPAFGQVTLDKTVEASTRILKEELFPIIDANPDCVDMITYANRLTLDVLGEVSFSYPFDGVRSLAKLGHGAAASGRDGKDDGSLFYTFNYMILTIVHWARLPLRRLLPSGENRRYKMMSDCLNSVVQSVVERRMSEQDRAEQSEDGMPSQSRPGGNARRGTDLLGHLLQRDADGKRMDMKHIIGNVRMFCFAGHETTSSTVSYALWHLASNTGAQERLRHEIDAAFFGSKVFGPSHSELRKLRYLDAVIKEALRMNAPAPIGRTACKDVVIGGKKGKKRYQLPADCDILIFPWWVHRQPSQWEDADEFRPERFLSDDKATGEEGGGRKGEGEGGLAPSHAYFPFSVGPRNCIGMQMALTELRLILSYIVWRYEIGPAEGAADPVPYMGLTIQANKVLIRFRLRDGR